MAISVADIDAELKRRETNSSSDSSGGLPSVEDIDAELVRRGATPAEEQGPPQDLGFMDQAKIMAKMIPAAAELTPMGKVAKNIADNPQDQLPLVGAGIGTAIAPGLGTAAGAGLGQIGARMVDIYKGDKAGTPFEESLGPMAQTAVAGLPEVGGVKAAAQKTAQGFAARGIGIKGALLKRLGLNKAREVGQTMMDEGVIKGTSLGTEATLNRAKDVAATSGKVVGEGMAALDDAGLESVNPRKLAKKVYDELRPTRLGGAYNNDELVAREVRDTILAHKNDGNTFGSAQDLKEKLQEIGDFNHMSDKLRAKMYRKASGIVRQALEDSVGATAGKEVVIEGGPSVVGTDLLPKGDKVVGEIHNIAPDVLERYKQAKKVYGAAETATTGLTNRLNAEASSGPSLRGTLIAAAAASQGHLTPALEALGVWEAGTRYGARAGASTINFLNNSAIAENVRRAVMSEFISRIRMKGGNEQNQR